MTCKKCHRKPVARGLCIRCYNRRARQVAPPKEKTGCWWADAYAHSYRHQDFAEFRPKDETNMDRR